MIPISVVIITYNEVQNIGRCIERAQLISDDIIIVDSGSTDGTLEICRRLCSNVIEVAWNGYGVSKNKGIHAAKHNWIFSLDADELPDRDLISYLHTIDYTNISFVYDFRFKVYFRDRLIQYGSWGRNHQVRLFNRTQARWSTIPVHETLRFSSPVQLKRGTGNVLHYSVDSIPEYYEKAENYARLSAFKYFEADKRNSIIKIYFSPVFNFLWNYLFKFGFLDGREGFIIARTSAWYTWKKYTLLAEMHGAANLAINEKRSYL